MPVGIRRTKLPCSRVNGVMRELLNRLITGWGRASVYQVQVPTELTVREVCKDMLEGCDSETKVPHAKTPTLSSRIMPRLKDCVENNNAPT